MNLTREEAAALLDWLNNHGYLQTPFETLLDWQVRTAPIAYQYALLVELACEHELSSDEPYCRKCGLLEPTIGR